MKTGLMIAIYDGLLNLKKGDENVIELDTGAKIILRCPKDRLLIVFKSKNEKMSEVIFDSYSLTEWTRSCCISIAIYRFTEFYDFFLDSFKDLLILKPSMIRMNKTINQFEFDEDRVCRVASFMQNAFWINESNYEKAIEELIEFFKEITLVTTGVKVDDNLELIKEN